MLEIGRSDGERIEGIQLWIGRWIDGEMMVEKTEQTRMISLDLNEKVGRVKCWLSQAAGRVVMRVDEMMVS